MCFGLRKLNYKIQSFPKRDYLSNYKNYFPEPTSQLLCNLFVIYELAVDLIQLVAFHSQLFLWLTRRLFIHHYPDYFCLLPSCQLIGLKDLRIFLLLFFLRHKKFSLKNKIKTKEADAKQLE